MQMSRLRVRRSCAFLSLSVLFDVCLARCLTYVSRLVTAVHRTTVIPILDRETPPPTASRPDPSTPDQSASGRVGSGPDPVDCIVRSWPYAAYITARV